MQIFKVIMLIIVIFVVCLFLVGEAFCLISMSRNFKKGIIYKTRNRIYDTADTSWFENHKREKTIKGSRGVNLVGYYFEHDEDVKDWVIVVHGYSSQALNMANYIKGFYEMGFNVLAPELMGMGKSSGNHVAMAGYDSDDVIIWCNELLREKGENINVGLMGASMGAATVMNTLNKGLPKNVEFFIEDSGYTNLKAQVEFQLETIYHLNFKVVYLAASLMTKIKYGFYLGSVDARSALSKTNLPGLILHGADDDFVPPYFADEAYKILNSPKEIKYFQGARHIRAEHQMHDEYWKAVKEFLKKYSSKNMEED